MPTELDLRHAMDELGDEAVRACAYIAGAVDDRRSHRSRTGLLAAVVASVVVVALIAVGVAWLHREPNRTPAGGDGLISALRQNACATMSTPTFSDFQIEDPAQTYIGSACAGYRSKTMYLVGGGRLGTIWVEAPGVFDPALIRGAPRVTGSGLTGYLIPLPHNLAVACTPTSSVRCGSYRPTVLVWEYAPNSYGVIAVDDTDAVTAYLGPNPAAKELAIAATVAAGPNQWLLLPMKLGWVPTGMVAVGVDNFGASGDTARGGLELAVPGHDASCPTGYACTGEISIDVLANTGALSPPPGEHVTINGYPGVVVSSPTAGPRVVVTTGAWYVDVSATPQSGVTSAELVRLCESMTLAASSFHYLDTWFEANTVMP